MRELSDELTAFARAIVLGEQPSERIVSACRNYPLEVAIEIYRNNYRGNLHDALAGAYPVIRQLVGEDFFRFMSRSYIELHPSQSANLHRYGAQLPAFLAAFEPVRTLPYLSDVAVLEWACHEAYFVDDVEPLALERLARVQPEHYPRLRLHLHPACRIVRSRYPLHTIWQAHQPSADGDFNIDLDSGASITLVSRKENVVQVSELSASEADWILRIQAGNVLGLATTATLECFPEFDLQATLLKLVSVNALADVSIGVSI